jgi:hypothetical protein
MTNLQDDSAPQEPGDAALNSSTSSGSSSPPTKLQHLRLHINAAAALSTGSTAGGRRSDAAVSECCYSGYTGVLNLWQSQQT